MSETSISHLLGHLGTAAETVAIINPSTGKKIYDLPQLNAEQVAGAAQEAAKHQNEWAEVPVSERAEVLLKLHDLMVENQDHLLDLLQLETGKARSHAFEEFAGSLGAARYYGKGATRFLARKRTRAGVPVLTKTWVERSPIGVVGVITPWNYPLALTMLDVLPALAAGNVVLQKADNQTALTTLFARQLAVQAGLPDWAWTIVVGDGASVGNAVTDNSNYVAFTGSTATGRRVAERASARLIGYSLELGGKNPMIVLEGANLKHAAELAMAGAFGSAGQLCVSIERVYVPNHLKESFLGELAIKMNSLKVGRSDQFDFDMGTLTGKAQLDRVSGFIDDALSNGSTLVSGGRALPETGPYFYAPTVVTDVPASARLARQEVFGPVLDVEGYDSLEDAIKMANDTELGLNASVVGPVAKALKVASRLQAGSVNINEGFRATFASMSSPMGGMKLSGKGRRNGAEGILRFTEARTIGLASGLLRLPLRGKDYVRMAPLMMVLMKVLRRLPL
jgi:succinate-semialdehyde dehydrogenase / glutarate-semialdehyde dehydrogenase